MSGLKYPTGEALELGDRVDYDGEDSIVEDVVDAESPNDATRWLAETAGSGCSLSNKAFGRVYVPVDAFDLLTFRRRAPR